MPQRGRRRRNAPRRPGRRPPTPRIDGLAAYLREAQAIASAALAFYGAIQIDGQRHYFNQPARFNAIFFANLLQLGAVVRTRAISKR